MKRRDFLKATALVAASVLPLVPSIPLSDPSDEPGGWSESDCLPRIDQAPFDYDAHIWYVDRSEPDFIILRRVCLNGSPEPVIQMHIPGHSFRQDDVLFQPHTNHIISTRFQPTDLKRLGNARDLGKSLS